MGLGFLGGKRAKSTISQGELKGVNVEDDEEHLLLMVGKWNHVK